MSVNQAVIADIANAQNEMIVAAKAILSTPRIRQVLS
jgi:hypothetical protein